MFGYIQFDGSQLASSLIKTQGNCHRFLSDGHKYYSSQLVPCMLSGSNTLLAKHINLLVGSVNDMH